MTAILVLYEDSRSARGTFGPHEFFLGCVADDKNCSPYDLRGKVRANPLNGVGKVLSHLEDLDDLNHLVPAGGPILTVIDDDRVREHFGSPPNTATKDLADQIRDHCSDPSRVTVVLLESNLESIVEAMRDCKETSAGLIAGALRKNLNDRDSLFEKVGRDPGRRAVRDCVRKRMASVERIVQLLGQSMP